MDNYANYEMQPKKITTKTRLNWDNYIKIMLGSHNNIPTLSMPCKKHTLLNV